MNSILGKVLKYAYEFALWFMGDKNFNHLKYYWFLP